MRETIIIGQIDKKITKSKTHKKNYTNEIA